jgi:hypothetical protein
MIARRVRVINPESAFQRKRCFGFGASKDTKSQLIDLPSPTGALRR